MNFNQKLFLINLQHLLHILCFVESLSLDLNSFNPRRNEKQIESDHIAIANYKMAQRLVRSRTLHGPYNSSDLLDDYRQRAISRLPSAILERYRLAFDAMKH